MWILRDRSRILLGNLSEALYIRVWTGRPRQEACERYRSLELLGETGKGKRNNNEEAMIHFMIFIFKLVTSIRVTRGFPVILIGFVGILTGASTWSAEETVDLPRYSGDRFRCRLDSIGYTFGGIVRDGGSREGGLTQVRARWNRNLVLMQGFHQLPQLALPLSASWSGHLRL